MSNSFAQKLAVLNSTTTATTQVATTGESTEQKDLRLKRIEAERQEEQKKRVAAEYGRQLTEIENMPATTSLRWEVFTALVWRIVAHSLFGGRAMKAIREAVKRNPSWFSNIEVFWYIKKTKDLEFGQIWQDIFMEKIQLVLTPFEVIHYTVAVLGATEAMAQIKTDAKDVEGAANEREALKQIATYMLNTCALPEWLEYQLLCYVERTGVFRPKQSDFMGLPQGEFRFTKLWDKSRIDPVTVARHEEIKRITALPVLPQAAEKKELQGPKVPSTGRIAFEAMKKARNAQKPNPQKNPPSSDSPFSSLAALRDKLPSAQNGTTHA